MEPVSIGLIIASSISFLLHAFHLKSKFRCGNSQNCCECGGEIDEGESKSKPASKK